MNKLFITHSPEETEKIAMSIGNNFKGGETIELLSDIGAGKTTFAKGLAAGTGTKDQVSSPSFTIANLYHARNFDIHHFDFYRLQDAGIVTHELHEKVHDKKDVVIIEWSAIVEHVLPEDRLKITIHNTGETHRQFEVVCPSSLNYLFKDVDLKSD